MAVFNEIFVGRFNRALQKLTGIKGGPATRQLASELVPSLCFPWGVELRYLESWERFGAVITQAALAAQTADIRFRNPVGSNMVAVFEQIVVCDNNPSSGLIFLENGAATADLTTIVPFTNGRLDNRTRPQPTVIGSRQNNGGALGSAFGQVVLLSATSFQWISTDNQEIPLLPGDALQFSMNTVNQQMLVSCVWRERFLEDSERF